MAYGSEELAKRTCTHRVHSTRLEINKHSAGHVLAASGLVVVDVDALELQIRVAVVGACGVNAMFVRNDFPEFSSNLSNSCADALGCRTGQFEGERFRACYRARVASICIYKILNPTKDNY